MKKTLTLFILLMITSCDYKPIYKKSVMINWEFNKIISEGDKIINRRIINSLGIKNNLSSNKSFLIDTDYSIEKTSKNSKGQVLTYRSNINLLLSIQSDGKTLKNRNFSTSFSYNNKANKYELTKYQNEVKNNLIKELIDEIILYLNLT